MLNPMDDADGSLILAAEECSPEEFAKLHRFSSYDEKIIKKLMVHGPVLLRGGRGTGKSALLIEAHNRIKQISSAFSVYVSLRYLPLLRSAGRDYEIHFCELLSSAINQRLMETDQGINFGNISDPGSLQSEISKLAQVLQKRVVLLFDDAAHIGREKPLAEFFDIFRTLSTSAVSCKASIYPGVTKFGIRFDVFNDSTVIDISRSESSPEFGAFFHNVLTARYPALAGASRYSETFSPAEFSKFLGRAVVGNMRGFIFACNSFEEKTKIGVPEVTASLLELANNYYWPLMQEVAPKLGVYEQLIDPSEKMAEKLFEIAAGKRESASIIVNRDIIQKYSKLFEILEYLGFISKREASRAMKSGGRGAVYALNLCNLLEKVQGKRLTLDLIREWASVSADPAEMYTAGPLFPGIHLPSMDDDRELGIFAKPIGSLKKSIAYPYGLTDDKVIRLEKAGIDTVGKLADAPDDKLLSIEFIGQKALQRIKDVLYQAIWM